MDQQKTEEEAKFERILDSFKVKIQKSGNDTILVQYGDNETVEVEQLKVTPTTFLNSAIVLYGASKSGKTNTSKYLLKKMKDRIPLAVCFCPSNGDNDLYTDVFTSSCIFDSLEYSAICNLWEFQGKRKEAHKKVNSLESLTVIAKKLNCTETLRKVNNMYLYLENVLKTLTKRKLPNIAEIEAKLRTAFTTSAVQEMKIGIKKNITVENAKLLDKTECGIIRYLDLNNNLLIMFDDCTVELDLLIREGKKIKDPKTRDIMGQLFTRGRHRNTTIILACHRPTKLDPLIRDNAHFSVLGNRAAGIQFLASTLKGDNQSVAVLKALFDPVNMPHKYAKPVFDNVNQKWYYMIPDNMDGVKVTVGSTIIRKYCDKLEKNGEKEEVDFENLFQ